MDIVILIPPDVYRLVWQEIHRNIVTKLNVEYRDATYTNDVHGEFMYVGVTAKRRSIYYPKGKLIISTKVYNFRSNDNITGCDWLQIRGIRGEPQHDLPYRYWYSNGNR